MRSILFILIAFMLSCAYAQTPTNAFNLNFNANTDGITVGYELWAWAGADTTGIDATDMQRVGYYSHDSLVGLYGANLVLVDVYPSLLNGEYIKAGLRAYGNSLWSAYGYSPAYQKEDRRPPAIPSFIRWAD